MRAGLRRLRFGLSTLLGLRRLGFFIPYRYAAGIVPRGYPALERIFAAAGDGMDAVLDGIETLAPELERLGAGRGPARFDQDWFAPLDAAAAYALVRRARPARIVEIGSGHSTRFLAAAVADGNLSTDILCIDPAPRAALAALPVRHRATILGDEEAEICAGLGGGDILFVDSSHVAMPGSDVDRIVLDILPRLAAGVLVHVHDVFLPDAYPREWEWRGYNEQVAVGALLQGGAFEIAFASHWLRTRRPRRLAAGVMARLPRSPAARDSSLWLRKRGV
jgi:predicted O-methyltransferase YrrM